MTNTLQHCQMAFNSGIEIGKISKRTHRNTLVWCSTNSKTTHIQLIIIIGYYLVLVEKKEME